MLALLPVASSAQNHCLIPGADPGHARASLTAKEIRLSNKCLSLEIEREDNSLGTGRIQNLWPNADGILTFTPNRFGVVFKDDPSPDYFKLVSEPVIREVPKNEHSSCAADHESGKEIDAKFLDTSGKLAANWRLILLDGSNYVREECSFTAVNQAVDCTALAMVSGHLPDAKVEGTAKGSPIVNGSYFCGLEHPRAESVATQSGDVSCSVPHLVPITETPVTVSAVFGVAPKAQLRRAFLNYVERERAHPYRTFLHYNSWLDIAYGKPYTAAESVEALNAFGEELVKKRGVKMDSSLFDDGWDDTNTVWGFHSGFPNGFTPLRETAAKYGFAPGVWLSPWGGYGDARTQRLATGKREGMEIDSQGYALSGPKYFERVRQVCLDFENKYGVNQFKFDGTGSPDKHYPGSHFDSDFDAAIELIHDLRQSKPAVFINLTTGTWPSPFWLRYADSTWRGGDDSSYAGVGSFRQRWITYRDSETYHNVVQKGPLYPLSSLMLHGIIYGKAADELASDPGNDFRDEVRSYFGTGTQLQEMYITHSLLTKLNWDDLAEAAKWSRANEDELVDTHWIGGDPLKLEVYGWAAWCPRKGSIVLRNPSDKEQSFNFDLADALQLPPGYKFEAISPWKSDAHMRHEPVETGNPLTFTLKPFEVLTLDLMPRGHEKE